MNANNGEIKNFRKNKRKKSMRKTPIVFMTAVMSVLCVCLLCVCAAAFFRPAVEQTPPFIAPPSNNDGDSADAYNRKEDFYTFLVCGVDRVSNNTDVMMLVSIDGANGKINVLQIPRDTYINRDTADFRVNRVNSIYTAAYNISSHTGVQRRKSAMERLCDSLEKSLCVTIDRYVLMDTKAFVGIIDAIGGVEYNVPFDMDYEDPEQDLYIHLKAGLQVLDGKAAEQFIRYRAGYATGDIGRVEARGDFLKAVYTQTLQKLSPESAVKIAGSLISTVTTDAGADDIAFFAAMVYGIGPSNIEIKTISGSTVQNPKTGAWIYYALNKKAALADINGAMNAFGEDITYDIFDKNAIFTDDPNGENPYISDYYYSDSDKTQ